MGNIPKRNIDKFIAVPEDFVFTLCGTCKFYLGDAKCKAFPEGIPTAIMNGQIKHIREYPGDHGIQFKEKT